MSIKKDKGKEFGAAMNGLMMIESIKTTGSESELFAKWAGYRAKVIMSSQEAQFWALKVKLLPSLLTGVNSALIMTKLAEKLDKDNGAQTFHNKKLRQNYCHGRRTRCRERHF